MHLVPWGFVWYLAIMSSPSSRHDSSGGSADAHFFPGVKSKHESVSVLHDCSCKEQYSCQAEELVSGQGLSIWYIYIPAYDKKILEHFVASVAPELLYLLNTPHTSVTDKF